MGETEYKTSIEKVFRVVLAKLWVIITASVIAAYARAAYKMNIEGMKGCKTVFDIPPSYLSPKTNEELRKELL